MARRWRPSLDADRDADPALPPGVDPLRRAPLQGLASRWPSRKPLSTSSRSSSPRPSLRPGTVAKADVIARLCASSVARRDRRRARRVRQDDAAREVGRGRSASVRVGRARRARRRRCGVPAIHRGRDPPRRAGPARGVRRVVGPRGIDLVEARPARRERAGRARAPAGAGARRSARRRQSVLPGRARGAARVRPGRLADRDREQGGAGAAARPLAGARLGARDRRARTSGWTSRRPSCCCEPPASSSTASELSELTERTEGWPAGLYLAALSMQAGAPSSASAAASPATTGSCPSTSAPSCCRGCRRPRRSSSSTPPCWIACAAACATPCCRRRGRPTRSRRSSARTASWCPSTGEASGIATTTCSASCCATSSSAASPTSCAELNRRAMAWCIANDLPEAAVVYGHAAGETDTVAGLVDALALPLYYDGRMETAGGVAGVVRRGRAGAVPRTRRLRSVVRAADGAARGGRAVARSRRRGDLDDPALGWQRHDRAVGRHAAGAHDARRRRAGARRRRSGAGSAPAEQLVDPRRAPHARRCACAARRDRSCDGGPARASIDDGAGGRRRATTSPWHRHSSRSSRPSRAPGARQRQRARAAQALVEEAGLGDYSSERDRRTWRRRVSHSTRRDTEDARAALARAHRLRPLLDHGLPWLTVQVGLELTRAHLALAERERRPHDSHRDRARARAPPGPGHPWSRMRGSCATASRRPPGRPVPGR